MGWLFGVALALVVASSSVAEAGARSFGLGGFLGYAKAADSEDGTLHAGASLTLRPIEFLGAILEVGYRQDDLTVSGNGAVSDAEVTYLPILFSGQFLPFGERLNPLAPFLLAGGGWHLARYRVRAEIDGERRTFEDWDASFGWHVGAGLDLNLGDHVTWTADLRWIDLTTSFDPIDAEADADAIWLTAGLKIFF